MTLYLARKVGPDNAVDESSTVYLGRCDLDDCRYMVDHRDVEIVNDALAGHARRAHVDPEALHRGWLTFTGSHPVAVANGPVSVPGSGVFNVTPPPTTAPPEPAPATSVANDPHLPPSPTPREAP